MGDEPSSPTTESAVFSGVLLILARQDQGGADTVPDFLEVVVEKACIRFVHKALNQA